MPQTLRQGGNIAREKGNGIDLPPAFTFGATPWSHLTYTTYTKMLIICHIFNIYIRKSTKVHYFQVKTPNCLCGEPRMLLNARLGSGILGVSRIQGTRGSKAWWLLHLLEFSLGCFDDIPNRLYFCH